MMIKIHRATITQFIKLLTSNALYHHTTYVKSLAEAEPLILI